MRMGYFLAFLCSRNAAACFAEHNSTGPPLCPAAPVGKIAGAAQKSLPAEMRQAYR
jgi:hypothetical protein